MDLATNRVVRRTGKLAYEVLKIRLPLSVLQSNAGFYIGTFDEEGPVSRESEEYYPDKDSAQYALDNNTFTQKWEP